MTRNYIVLFIIIWLFIAISLILIVGNNGILAQNSKNELLKEKRLTLSASEAQLDLLENKNIDSNQLDQAFKLGYIQKGDQVYFFEKTSEQQIEQIKNKEITTFVGYNKYLILLVSFGFTLVLFFLKGLISFIVHKDDDKELYDESDIEQE